MKNAHQTDGERVSMLETVKQCLEHSRQVTSERFGGVEYFLQLLDNWGYAVVSKHSGSASAPAAEEKQP